MARKSDRDRLDEFAAAAAAGILASADERSKDSDMVAHVAYRVADKMLAESRKRKHVK